MERGERPLGIWDWSFSRATGGRARQATRSSTGFGGQRGFSPLQDCQDVLAVAQRRICESSKTPATHPPAPRLWGCRGEEGCSQSAMGCCVGVPTLRVDARKLSNSLGAGYRWRSWTASFMPVAGVQDDWPTSNRCVLPARLTRSKPTRCHLGSPLPTVSSRNPCSGTHPRAHAPCKNC